MTVYLGRNRNRNRGGRTLATTARETAASLPPDSPVLALFRAAAAKLIERHDRHERLVKLSRDVTIESKRIIFLLHSALKKEGTEKVLKEAVERLNKVTNGPIKSIAYELENSPNYLHSRAVSPGLQEYIEAKTLCHLMQHKELVSHSTVQAEFVFTTKVTVGELELEKTVVTLLPQVDFMLGVADLTGELMRRAINSLSSGESEECFHLCQVVRDLYTGYLGIFGGGKEMMRKLSTTRANVSKVEAAVYALHVRGGEAPPSLLLAAAPPQPGDHEGRDSDDEGYF